MKTNYIYLIILVLSICLLVTKTVYSSVQNENINQIFQATNKFVLVESKKKPQTNNTPLEFNYPPKFVSNKNDNKDVNKNKRKTKSIKRYSLDDLNRSDWAIFIPSINTLEKIYEGTDLNTLEKGVGHFNETKKVNGNICLAGHNIGITVSPFRYLYKLKKGDLAYYKYKNRIDRYELASIKEIDESDFKYIEETKKSHITIITCIAGKKSKRLVFRFNLKD